ncbi:MAG: putative DNA modification/repair radical SAM protein [Oscillospiraceae bacterium]
MFDFYFGVIITELLEKLKILGDSAKYDAACTSSGSDRGGTADGIGNAVSCGICHSFAADGRCISLLKVLMTNYCIFDCKYCINRKSNDVERARFEPRELAELVINFYKRNYIEGLFLSSGIIKNPDYTCEQMIEAISLLRFEYKFNGYIHAKAIPGADPLLIERLGFLVDRMSVNIELPSQESLAKLAPDKSKRNILLPMHNIKTGIEQNHTEIVKYKAAPKFVPAGQSTQMIIGATPDSDFQIIRLSEALYKKFSLKRVFYSAYVPVGDEKYLPSKDTKPPLLREHRLYQADWLLRFYGFEAGELLDEKHDSFNPLLDPKCNWAVDHPEFFPVEVNKASYEMLLRVPGIGVNSAKRIMMARRSASLDFKDLKKLGIVLKRAQYFITCKGKRAEGLKVTNSAVMRELMSASVVKKLDESGMTLSSGKMEQLSFFDAEQNISMEDMQKCLTGQL